MGGVVKTWVLAFPREYVFLGSSWPSLGYTWRTGCRYSKGPRVAIWACRSPRGNFRGSFQGKLRQQELERSGRERR